MTIDGPGGVHVLGGIVLAAGLSAATAPEVAATEPAEPTAAVAAPAATAPAGGAQATTTAEVPVFRVDPFWPQELPHNWILGQASGVAVDGRDHVWLLHRPGTLDARQRGEHGLCCVPAPPVIEFAPDGSVVRAWGGPGARLRVAGERARDSRRPPGSRVDRRQRRRRRAHPQVHRRRRVPAPDRTGGGERREQRHREPRPPGRHPRRPGRQRGLRRRRLRQPARHRLRRGDRRVPAALGRGTATGRTTSSSRPTIPPPTPFVTTAARCTTSPCPPTGSSTWPTGRTTGCRCSARTGASCGRPSFARRRSAAARSPE